MADLRRSGFTLYEVLVVVMILGVAVTFALPSYLKQRETQMATSAVGLLSPIAIAHKAYGLRNNDVWLNQGQITGCGGSANCAADEGAGNPCTLVSCGFIQNENWAGLDYAFYTCNAASTADCCDTTSIACAQRQGGSGDYATWMYRVSTEDAVTAAGTGTPSPYAL